MTGAGLRRLIHVGSGAVLLAAWFGSWNALRVGLGATLALGLVLEWLRISHPSLGSWIGTAVPAFRSSERARLSGATWLCMGYGLAACLPAPAPAAGIVVGALADPAASWVGSWNRKSEQKSLRGMAAAFAVGAGALLLLSLPIATVLLGAAVGAVVERWSGPLNDNLVVPPAVALLVWITA